MLPTAKSYLGQSGLSDTIAAYVLIGLFLAGVVIISIFSHIAHRYMPSHVVDCIHTHESHDLDLEYGIEQEHLRYHQNRDSNDGYHCDLHEDPDGEDGSTTGPNEQSPLLPARSNGHSARSAKFPSKSTGHIDSRALHHEPIRHGLGRRVTKFFGLTKDLCDENGPCYGFSQTCGIDCQKVLGPRKFFFWGSDAGQAPKVRPASLAASEPEPAVRPDEPDTPLTVRHVPLDTRGENEPHRPHSEHQGTDYFSPESRRSSSSWDSSQRGDDERTATGSPESSRLKSSSKSFDEHSIHSSSPHHHHVPHNAFLSIGLQTSLAIALHKLPEGFITYATNHASPALGMTVFIALFIHNITDGFALALPLFMAIRSRVKAIFWASLLGGISQPAGAGLAALWIWYCDRGKDVTDGTSWGVYGGMFAVTAGIMASVGLHLFSEGLSLTHNPNICIFSAIAGMGLLGVSFALTA